MKEKIKRNPTQGTSLRGLPRRRYRRRHRRNGIAGALGGRWPLVKARDGGLKPWAGTTGQAQYPTD